tara:strand:+ start:1189 stop:3012 length:1824 start_codon:yes stop_codon:yes gene_type:complete
MKDFDFKRFFDESLDMLCIANTAGRFLNVNDSFSRVLGYPKSVFLSDSFLALIHTDDIEKTQKEMAKIEAGENSLSFENRYQHINGHYLTFSWNGHIDKQKGLIYATARDVTVQRNYEAKLAQIEKTLNKESIIAETDTKGVIISVNDKFCEISGFTREELIGQTHRIVNSNFHPKSFFIDLWQTIKNKKIWSGVIKNKKKNGEYYFVHTIITPITDHEDTVTSYLAIRQDITESVEQKGKLAKTLDILNETSAIAKVGGWELKVDTGELTWTDETFRILEVEKKLDQKPLLSEGVSLFVPEHKSIIEAAVGNAIETGTPYSLELKAKTAKGNELWVHTSGQANYHDGKVVSISGVIQDIDARKQAENKYNLERLKSFQSNKLASLGELAASMAHEINNPLGIISGYSELMLLSEDMNDSQSEMLEAVLKSCERISHIVNNLKRFSRKDEQRALEQVSLEKIIGESISLANPRLKRELIDLKFTSETDSKADKILCNTIEIEQVFLNLINNAIDALIDMPHKQIEITISVHEQMIECRVIDHGLGIPAPIISKIFNPFYTTKAKGAGTGLGLSIVKDIIEEHGGSIKLEIEAEYTTFVLFFPRVKSE